MGWSLPRKKKTKKHGNGDEESDQRGRRASHPQEKLHIFTAYWTLLGWHTLLLCAKQTDQKCQPRTNEWLIGSDLDGVE